MKSSAKTNQDGIRLAEGASVEYGNVSLPADAFEPKNVRVRISIMVPEDVLLKLRELGKKHGKPYQTLANDLLREAVSHGAETGERFAIIKAQKSMLKELAEARVATAKIGAQLDDLLDKLPAKRPAKKRASR